MPTEKAVDEVIEKEAALIADLIENRKEYENTSEITLATMAFAKLIEARAKFPILEKCETVYRC